MNDDQLLRYSRQILLPQIGTEGQDKLLNAKVLLIGLGGLGSPIAMYLAAAGIGNLYLNDFDTVDLTNLQRQIMHGTQNVGHNKTDSAEASLAAINPHIKITKINKALTAEELIEYAQKVDIIIDATDNFTSRFQINHASVKTKTPLVSGAAIRFEGQVSVFRPDLDNQACYQCLYHDEGELQETCSETGVIGPLLGIIGNIQALEALKIILDIGERIENQLLIFDALNMEWRKIKLRQDPNCQTCG